jgi:hypothetical protein
MVPTKKTLFIHIIYTGRCFFVNDFNVCLNSQSWFVLCLVYIPYLVLVLLSPSSSSNDTVATAVHQIMIELSKAVSEEDRVTVITKLVLNLM